jgi:DNA-binding MarR family transcriptional regulator
MDYTTILVNLRKIVRSVNLESKRVEKEFGVSIPQLLCLHYLTKQSDYQATVTSIANYLNLNLSTVTGIISRLEAKYLVAKLPKAGDRRKTSVVLTAQGFELLKKTPELKHQQLNKKLSKLSEKDLTDLNHSLQWIVTCFELDNESASPLITIDDFTSYSPSEHSSTD